MVTISRDIISKLVVLAVAGVFAGSAIVMKVAPAADLLPGELSRQMVKQYDAFYNALNEVLGSSLTPLGNAHGLMLLLALLHLGAAALLVIPSGTVTAKIAAVWAAVTMIGAEYVVTTTGAIPPFVPEQFRSMVPPMMHATHLILLGCAAMIIIFNYSSLGLAAKLWSTTDRMVFGKVFEAVCKCGYKFWSDGLFCTQCGRERERSGGFLLQLLLAMTLAGSAVVMKCLPLSGLAPGDFAQEVLASYDKFIAELQAIPGLAPAMGTVGISVNTHLMGTLAAAHLMAAFLLVVPSGVWPARLASGWMLIVMVGAEYLCRKADVAPPQVPEKMKSVAMWGMTCTHVALGFVALVVLVTGLPSLRLFSRLRSALHVRAEDLPLEKEETQPQPEQSSGAAAADVAAEPPRGRGSASTSSRARASTPVAKAESRKKGYQQAGGIAARGAAAAQE
mmetsp:Transcript_75550/g.179489  ORF Transcript_75550/g.179489 Transcript_75550/m.179489 type:complete len:449 (-) Transcript_75550:206-1552(-)|eukprot:CAMPEP_0178435956 /NCGR_PEP_ID=MMETSP0689_2-20121128/34193_1 /TAXON_ID=160604 /ORGANISM="Amphidinium massartii, Strain CS-259" /LENGTH=448 /DNA_ID=CAMNT_0020058041 /DNA_START=42 /DNA_END=1388 /DNA_ORIENTATION=+